ncbi:MAG TPA: Nramp family divalent metal transporter [Polyangiaceae bacterium]
MNHDATEAELGWRGTNTAASRPVSHRAIPVPLNAGFWRKLLAFSGPGFMVAVGYMDPGNWATDIAGGAQFGYTLLSVILLSNLMAVLLQHLAAKLGIVSGRDLAQACREHYPRPMVFFLWVLCELAIAACDLAEVIGSAIALQLLFHIPLLWGCVVTAADVMLVLLLESKGFRYLESVVLTLMLTIGGCFAVELLLARPEPAGEADVLLIADGSVTHRVPVDAIDWASSAGNYVEIAWGQRVLLHRSTLAALAGRLGPGFARIHRTRIVRRAAVEKVETDRNGDFTVTLSGGAELRGSRRYRSAL